MKLDTGRDEAEIEPQDEPQSSVGQHIPFAIMLPKKSGSPLAFLLIEPVQTPAILSILTGECQRPEINRRDRKRAAADGGHLE